MPARPFDPAEALIRSGLDLSRPFSRSMANSAGLDTRRLARIVDAGLLLRPLRGAYVVAGLPDSLDLRLQCTRLVVPPDGVVTDRTAAWLHGAPMALAPNDHLLVPKVSVFQSPGNRLRNDLNKSGERRLSEHDVVDLAGLRVTTPLRTACDLGRLLQRDAALAALDALLGLGVFDQEELLVESERFRGYRGVRKFRMLAPLADPGSESFGESALRLRWYDAVLGVRPETQIEIADVRMFRLDMGDRTWRYAAEYDGAAYHGPDRALHDERRRSWLEELGWTVDVFRRADVFGKKQNAVERLKEGLARAKVRIHAGSAG